MWVKAFPSKGKQGEDSMTILLDTEGMGMCLRAACVMRRMRAHLRVPSRICSNFLEIFENLRILSFLSMNIGV